MKLLLCHKLARCLANLPIEFKENRPQYTIHVVDEQIIEVTSFSCNSVSCRFRGQKYNFQYIFKQDKLLYVTEYFRKTKHYLNISTKRS